MYNIYCILFYKLLSNQQANIMLQRYANIIDTSMHINYLIIY